MTSSESIDQDEGKRQHHEYVSELRMQWAAGIHPDLSKDPWLTVGDANYIVFGEVI